MRAAGHRYGEAAPSPDVFRALPRPSGHSLGPPPEPDRMLKRRLPLHLLSVLVGVPILAAIPGGSMILAILGISFLIFIHEWGHFYACRLTGTRTETFSIGFGPRLFGWEKDRNGKRRFTVGRRQLDPADHAMDFRIAAVPLGGYVKMAGEIAGEGGTITGRPPEPDEFPSKSAWARTFIICAGVIMNFITAIVFYFITIQGGKAYRAPMLGTVTKGAAAWQAGLEAGDRVVSINGKKTITWIDLQMEIAFADRDGPNTVVVQRGNEKKTFEVTPSYDEERGILAFGVGSVTGIQFGEGEDAVLVGPDEHVLVDGAPAVGGAEAMRLYNNALQAGHFPVQFQNAAGKRILFGATPAAKDAPLEDAGAKVGLAAYAPPKVTKARGQAAASLAEGDVLRAALAGSKRIDIHSGRELDTLVFEPSLSGFEIERAGKTVKIDVALPNPAAIAGFLANVAVKSKTDTRVYPLAAGTLYETAGLHRYPSAPALEAGIPVGAPVKKIGTVLVREWSDILAALKKTQAGTSIDITYGKPDGTEATASVTPVALEGLGRVQITVVEHKERWETDGVGQAFAMGAGRTWRETKNVFRTIGALFTGSISFNKNIAGPITLITASKRFAEDSLLRLIWFLAYVSVMLAVLNILPIPVLDGGHLVFILIEKIKGKPLTDETIFRFQKVGFLMLLVLMFFAFKNDFTRLFS